MSLQVAINHPQFPKDTEFDVGGVLVLNGKSTTLDENQEMEFISRHRLPVKEKLEGNEFVKVTGSPKYSASEVSKLFPEPVTETETEVEVVPEGSDT